MLVGLAIRDFVIVEALELVFEPGFTVLTGETGAGKSILIDALALALGDRADADVIRPGAERAEIEASFDITRQKNLAEWLAEQALDGDPGQLLLRRVVDRGGRSRAFVNGRSATLAQLREAGEWLVDIHGQHAHQSLMKADAQRKVLDTHAGLDQDAARVAEAYRAWQRLRKARDDYAVGAAAREAERDQIGWQVEELQRLAPRLGEWAEIEQEHSRLEHAASLIEGAEAGLETLSEGEGAASGALSAVLARLRALTGYDAALNPVVELLEGAQTQLQEATYSLRHYRDRVDLDPARLKEVTQRLESLHSTARKFRVRPEELAELLARQSARLAELQGASDLAQLERDEAAARKRYDDLASALTRGRTKAGGRLAKDVSAAMKELALGIARFEVAFEPIEGGSAHGDERVEFRVATNAGAEPKPLAKVASGGELSRISLAIQVITSKLAAVPTLIFDEVDAGIGGAVAEIVGRKLATLGEQSQVLCVTHLAQVAAQADQQWAVAKIETRGRTASQVKPLEPKARIDEIARMLGGTAITATTRKHAAEMLGERAK